MKAEDPWPVVNGRRKAPVGKLRALFNQLHQIRCCLCEEDSDAARQRFSGLYLLTRGNPCNGCFYWNEVGSACSVCFRTCSFTKKQGLSHDTVKWFIKNVPQLNKFWVWTDDLFGYGKPHDPKEYWSKPFKRT